MEKRELLRTEIGKCVYATDDPQVLWVEYIGPNAAFHNSMTAFFFEGLAEDEVTCYYVGQLSATESAVVKLNEIPMTITAVNGEGEQVCFAYYRHDERPDVPATRIELVDAGIATGEALERMEDVASHVCEVLGEFFARHNITLGEVDLRFGHLAEHFLVLAGEFTPETMRLYDPETGERLWEGGMENSYDIILERINAQ